MQDLQDGAEVWILKPCLLPHATKRKQIYFVDVKPMVVTSDNRERLAAGWGVRVFGGFDAAITQAMDLPEVYYDELPSVLAALQQAAKQ